MSQRLNLATAIDIQAAEGMEGLTSFAPKQRYEHGMLTIKTPAGMQLTMGQKPAPKVVAPKAQPAGMNGPSFKM